MKLGIDISSQKELDEIGAKYFYKGKQIEPFNFFASHCHISTARFRLWVDPYDEEGHPYGGGTNDLDTFIELAKRSQKEGMKVMLDFHYSDFYVDPSRQKLPKSWTKYHNFLEILKVMYEYTLNTLKTIKENGIDLIAIQVGNEITHGFLWPYGDIEKEYSEDSGGGFKGFTMLLKEAIKACKEIYPNAKTLLHLEHSGSYDMQDWFFSNIVKNNVEFDVIGESYYPYWHGPFSMFESCIKKLKEKYKKEIWVVELGYQFEETINPNYDEVTDAVEGDFIIGNVNGRIPYPQTKKGQADYIAKIIDICKKVGVEMLFYWEPTWIYMENNGWASEAGQRYCGLEPMPPVNSWIIETLFDQKGEANEAVEVFNQDYVDSI